MRVEMNRYNMLMRQGYPSIIWDLPIFVQAYENGEPLVYLEVLEYVDVNGNVVEVEPAYD